VVVEDQSKLTKLPRVSVLMTIYNAAPYLRAAIDSLIEQTFLDWELIVVENGSVDASFEILKSYSDHRIKIHRFEKNIGRTPALRYAFNLSSTEFIAVLDADDVAFPERFFRQVEFMDENPNIALVGTWAKYIDKRGKFIGAFIPPVMSGKLIDCLGWANPIAHSSVMYRANLANEFGGYPENFVWAQDMAMFIAMASSYPIAIIDEYLCSIRVQDSNMTSSRAYSMTIALERLLLHELAAKLIKFTPRGKRLNRGAIAFSKIRIGMVHISLGRVSEGLRYIVSVLSTEIICLLSFLAFRLTTGRISVRRGI